MKVTEEELHFKRNLLKTLLIERQKNQNLLDFTIHQSQMDELLKLSNEKIDKIREEQKSKHVCKLAKLGIFDHASNKNVSRRREMDKMAKVEMADQVFNLSNRTLSNEETLLLSKGLKYGIKSKSTNTFEILARFEEFAESMDYLPIAEKADGIRANLNSKSNFYKQLQIHSDEFIKLSKNPDDNLTSSEHETLINLAKDKSIIISKADKGNAVKVQNTTD